MRSNFFSRISRYFIKTKDLAGKGERVDLVFDKKTNISELDMYQQSHMARYTFAVDHVPAGKIIGDFACGTGYGTILLAEKALRVVGVDIDKKVISSIQERYSAHKNVLFQALNLLELKFENEFDTIIAFETIEHFSETEILQLLTVFCTALKQGGTLIFSTPYMQLASKVALKMGFHKTFLIDENKIGDWLQKSGFTLQFIKYQDYQTHTVVDKLPKPDFIICQATKQ